MFAAPVGIFDSGLGGLSVWREVVKLLPCQSMVYVSDSAWCPYGPRDVDELIGRTQKISRFLIEQGCTHIVVACNTATAAAIDALRATFPIPFVGMEPAVKPAALHSKTGVVGILATQGTFRGRLYQDTSRRFANGVHIMEQVGEGLVELVEQGMADSPEALQLLQQYIGPMLEAGADHLVLGCTHYPFLIPAIEKICRGHLVVVDPAPAVAQHLCTLMGPTEPSNKVTEIPAYNFYASGSIAALQTCYDAIAPPIALARFFSWFHFA